jgi:hypothetical protein
MDNIKVDLPEIRCEGLNWIHLDPDSIQWWALVNTVPSGSMKAREFID